jgi:hypothetical protein
MFASSFSRNTEAHTRSNHQGCLSNHLPSPVRRSHVLQAQRYQSILRPRPCVRARLRGTGPVRSDASPENKLKLFANGRSETYTCRYRSGTNGGGNQVHGRIGRKGFNQLNEELKQQASLKHGSELQDVHRECSEINDLIHASVIRTGAAISREELRTLVHDMTTMMRVYEDIARLTPAADKRMRVLT